MQITYSTKDLLYLRLDERTQEVGNHRVSEDIVLDMGKDEKLAGIEIMNASLHVRMDGLFSLTYKTSLPPVQLACGAPEEYGNRINR